MVQNGPIWFKMVQNALIWSDIVQNGSKLSQKKVQNGPKLSQNCPKCSNMVQIRLKSRLKMTSVGATAVWVTTVRNNLKF